MGTFGGRLRASREQQIWSQADLARESGLSKTTIVQLEADRDKARPSTIRKLATALGVTPQWLAFGEAADPGDLAK